MYKRQGKGGGVKIAKSLYEVKEIAKKMIGMMLITPQTPPEGKKVRKILIAEDVYYPGESETKEFYMSILLDRKNCKNIIMYSTEGGMDIEKVATFSISIPPSVEYIIIFLQFFLSNKIDI